MTKETLLTVIKFGLVGGTVALLHILFVYFLTSIAGVWYLLSSFFSYACAIILNFVLQKGFVYKRAEDGNTASQFYLFTATSLVVLLLNTVFMYLLVSTLLWHYLVAQVVVVAVLSALTFFVNRNYIFR